VTSRLTGGPPNFVLGFLLAPFAGAIAAVVVVVLVLLPDLWDDLNWNLLPALLAASAFALIVSFVATFLLGGAASLYVKRKKKRPLLRTALLTGWLLGFLPFATIGALIKIREPNATFAGWTLLPAAALAASSATAFTFWRLALRERPVSAPQAAA
jgi:hypothetical protein